MRVAEPQPLPMEDTLVSFPASSHPESQPAPDTSAAASEPAPEMEKLAERNLALTKKLKEAIIVANACHRALECELSRESGKGMRKLDISSMG